MTSSCRAIFRTFGKMLMVMRMCQDDGMCFAAPVRSHVAAIWKRQMPST